MKKFLIGAVALLCILAGCTFVPDSADGKIVVAVEERAGVSLFGVENVTFESSYYKVSIRNTDKNIAYDEFRVEKDASIMKTVASGNTTVRVDAYNEDDVKIGTGSSTVLVKPMEENPVTVKVEEIRGTAELTVTVTSKVENMTLSAKLWKAGDDISSAVPAYTIALSGTKGTYTGNETVANGTYKVYIDNGNDSIFVNTVRVAAGHAVTVRGNIDDNWKITVEIVDTILRTPVVKITGNLPTYTVGAPYSLTATVEGLEEPSITWFIDGNELSNGRNSRKISGTLPVDGTCREGKHTFTVLAEKGNVAWTDSFEFTVNKAN